MTRPKPIRMNPNRLPELTPAQKWRIKEHRRYWKGFGKVSVVRKGQITGYVCVTVTTPDNLHRYWYDPTGRLVKRVIERPLFTLSAREADTESALTYES
jgi:hypothetical protein